MYYPIWGYKLNQFVGVKNWSLPGDVGERGGVLMRVLCGDGTGEG